MFEEEILTSLRRQLAPRPKLCRTESRDIVPTERVNSLGERLQSHLPRCRNLENLENKAMTYVTRDTDLCIK